MCIDRDATPTGRRRTLSCRFGEREHHDELDRTTAGDRAQRSPARHGYPFGLTLVDLAARGYRADEFFLDGDATRYRPAPGTELGPDGRWEAEPAGTAPYRTTLLVYRPVDPERFNGTVVLHWNNVSAGYDLFSGDTPEILDGGYAFAGVTTQRVGVHGLPDAPQGLLAWDPERYGTLSIASDDDSFDIFTQAARAVGPDRDRTTDPLGGLDVDAGRSPWAARSRPAGWPPT